MLGFNSAKTNTNLTSTLLNKINYSYESGLRITHKDNIEECVLGCWYHGQMVTKRTVTAVCVHVCVYQIVSNTCPRWTQHKRNAKGQLNSTRKTPNLQHHKSVKGRGQSERLVEKENNEGGRWNTSHCCHSAPNVCLCDILVFVSECVWMYRGL